MLLVFVWFLRYLVALLILSKFWINKKTSGKKSANYKLLILVTNKLVLLENHTSYYEYTNRAIAIILINIYGKLSSLNRGKTWLVLIGLNQRFKYYCIFTNCTKVNSNCDCKLIFTSGIQFCTLGTKYAILEIWNV